MPGWAGGGSTRTRPRPFQDSSGKACREEWAADRANRDRLLPAHTTPLTPSTPMAPGSGERCAVTAAAVASARVSSPVVRSFDEAGLRSISTLGRRPDCSGWCACSRVGEAPPPLAPRTGAGVAVEPAAPAAAAAAEAGGRAPSPSRSCSTGSASSCFVAARLSIKYSAGPPLVPPLLECDCCSFSRPNRPRSDCAGRVGRCAYEGLEGGRDAKAPWEEAADAGTEAEAEGDSGPSGPP